VWFFPAMDGRADMVSRSLKILLLLPTAFYPRRQSASDKSALATLGTTASDALASPKRSSSDQKTSRTKGCRRE
jgi:hypothetical protein